MQYGNAVSALKTQFQVSPAMTLSEVEETIKEHSDRRVDGLEMNR